MTDITAVKQAQAALQESEQRFQSLIDAIPQQVWTASADGKLQYVSQRMTDYFGCTFDDIINSGWKNFVHPDDISLCTERWEHSLKTSEQYEIEFRLKGVLDGSYRWHLSRAVPLKDRQGEIIKWFGTNTDITERKQFEQDLKLSHVRLEKKVAERTAELKLTEKTARKLTKELAHLNRLFIFDEMSTSIIHQLSQPLGSIVNNASTAKLLISKKGNTKDVQAVLAEILKDCERTRNIIDKNRGLLKKNEYLFKAMSLKQVISSVVDVIQGSIVLNKVSLVVESEDAVKIKVDKIHIEQVFLNLLMNAIESMQESPKKELRIQARLFDSENVIISVSDTGKGFDKKTKKNLFKPFFTTKEGGLGLGLPICRSIIESHHGRFWGENNPQMGATFYFTLPIVKSNKR